MRNPAFALLLAVLLSGCDLSGAVPSLPGNGMPYEENCGVMGVAQLKSKDNRLYLALLVVNQTDVYRFVYGVGAVIVDSGGGEHPMGRYKNYYDLVVQGVQPRATYNDALPIDPQVIPAGNASLALQIGVGDVTGIPPVAPSCQLVLPLN